MIYLLETELPENKSIYLALPKVFGINQFRSSLICKKLGFSRNFKLSQITTEQLAKLIKIVECENFLLNKDLKKSKDLVFKQLLQIKTYRGSRRIRGLPIRGQRTHTNAKTAAKFR